MEPHIKIILGDSFEVLITCIQGIKHLQKIILPLLQSKLQYPSSHDKQTPFLWPQMELLHLGGHTVLKSNIHKLTLRLLKYTFANTKEIKENYKEKKFGQNLRIS